MSALEDSEKRSTRNTRKELLAELDEARRRIGALERAAAERERFDGALRESEQRLSAIADNLPGMVYRRIEHADGRVSYPYISARHQALLGFAPEKARDDPEYLLRATHPDDRQGWLEAIAEAASCLTPLDAERRVLTATGEIKWFRTLARTHRSANGDVVFDGIALDVTDRREAERAFRETEARFKAVIENSPNLVYLKDLEGRYQLVNREFEQATGWSSEEALGKSARDWSSAPTANIYEEHDREVIKTGTVVTREEEVRHVDGSIRTHIATKFPIHDADGGIAAVVGIDTDITERKQAEEALRESEARFRRVFQEGPLGMALVAPDNQMLVVNETFCRMLGYEEEEMRGRSFAEITHPDDINLNLDQARRLFAGKIQKYQVEKRYLRKNGEILWGSLTASVIAKTSGDPFYGLAMIEDITDRKRAEEELRERETLLTQAVTMAGLGHWVWDEITDKCIFCSEQMARILDFPSVEAFLAVATHHEAARAWIHPDDWARFNELMRDVMRQLTPLEAEFRIVRPDGEIRHVREVTEPVLDEAGTLIRSIGTALDITEHKRAEAALRESEARLRQAQEIARIGNFVWGEVDDEVIHRSDVICEIYGLPAEKAPHDSNAILRMVHPDDHDRVRDAYAMAAASAPYDVEFRIVRPDGEIRHVHELGNPEHDEAGVLIRSVGTVQDITERIRAEGALREREELFRAAFEDVGVGIVMLELDGRFRRVNRAFAEMVGYTERELRDATFADITHPDDSDGGFEALRQLVEGETQVAYFEKRYVHKNGHLVWASISSNLLRDLHGRPLHTIDHIQDVTERKQAEEQLRQAQKMEAVGQLTGGIAHDFNNLLAVILGNVELAKEELKGDGALERYLEAVVRAALHGADLTARLLVFSREQTLHPRDLDLNALVGGMTELLLRTLGETIEIETRLAAEPGPVHADQGQLENALLNLAINARDAMPGGGKLTIETADVGPSEGQAIGQTGLGPGRYVMLAVSDTGAGMAPEIVDRVFEPFFTTKDVGKGTGLGLSMVYGFVKQSGGHVEIDSEPGRGTTLRLYLPRKEDGPVAEPPDRAARSRSGGRGQTILVVEDEQAVRELAVSILRSLGYETVEAPYGEAGLAVLDRTPNVSLLFSDVGLPGGMNGCELAQEARRRRPGLKVLLTSGYTDFADIDADQIVASADLIPKPFRKAELAERLRAILGE